MPINYTIKADVIDIKSDIPKEEDIFLIDTNVWFWATYSNATSSTPQYDYSQYLNKALAINSKIHHSGLSLAELSHIIEKTEWEIYNQWVSSIKLKEFRHNITSERQRIVSEVKAVWSQVTNLAQPLEISIDNKTVGAALNRFQTEKVDGYDLFILESMKKHGVEQVITDDGDFSTVPNIKVFTSNRNVINTAKIQGKLLSR